jgi:hypothetical protein
MCIIKNTSMKIENRETMVMITKKVDALSTPIFANISKTGMPEPSHITIKLAMKLRAAIVG